MSQNNLPICLDKVVVYCITIHLDEVIIDEVVTCAV